MSNMSYCRWENTLSDLRDCNDALNDMVYRDGVWGEISTDDDTGEEDGFSPLGEYEQIAVRNMIVVLQDMLEKISDATDK